LKARARSASAIRRDGEILDATTVEIVEKGVDALGMLAVARRCGLAAGSVYSRHETVGELLIAVWEERFREPTLGFVGDALKFARGEDVDLASRIVEPSDELLAGLEILIVARRFPELDEVVRPELLAVLDWDRRDAVERGRVAYILGYSLGLALRQQISEVPRKIVDFSYFMFTMAVRSEVPVLDSSWKPNPGEALSSSTGEELRDALINSAMSVIGQVGLASTTVSRIGRRAGQTAGAVYTCYDTKDDLLIDALRTMLNEAIYDNRSLTDRALDRATMADASASLMVRGAGIRRRPWLRFRLEAYVAATHRRDLAAVIDEVHETNLTRYRVLLEKSGLPDDIVVAVAVAGQSIPIGLSILDVYLDGLDSLDYRVMTSPLFGRLVQLGPEP